MIYIVEDDRNIQEIELFALKNSGYQATGFETAKEFYKALNEKLPELILLDIMLPDEDGLSILKRLRSRADTQKIPVILVTAKTSEIDKVKGLDGGADDYIAKPFGVMEMIARVKALLRRSGGMEESLLTCGNVTLDGEKRMVYVDGKSPCYWATCSKTPMAHRLKWLSAKMSKAIRLSSTSRKCRTCLSAAPRVRASLSQSTR